MSDVHSPLLRLLARGRRAMRPLLHADLLDLAPLVSIVVLLLSAFNEWYMVGPFTVLALVGLVWRSWRSTSAYWYLAALLFGVACYLNWSSCDNHKYLMVYWCLALCVVFSLPQEHRAAAMAYNARVLLALCMLLAVSWRVASDNYLSGAFFHYTLLTDERFLYFSQWLGDASAAALAENRELRDLLVAGHLRGIDLVGVTLADDGRLAAWGQFLTWWTLLIEGSIGVAFLLPDWRPAAWIRNSLLLLFGATTYLFAPVRGFGWMLMLLGLAQCEERDRWFRVAFVGVMLAIHCYTMPYGAILEGLRGILGI